MVENPDIHTFLGTHSLAGTFINILSTIYMLVKSSTSSDRDWRESECYLLSLKPFRLIVDDEVLFYYPSYQYIVAQKVA